jgi:Asp-tRNA(Asn)/Glu-tRNA(Gln) amidotransferase A subunit family amidase
VGFGNQSVFEVARQVRERERSARETTAEALAGIRELNGQLNAFVAVDEARAFEQADAVDALVASGADPGPLAGVPIGVKDLEDAVGYPTTYGSVLEADGPPAVRDSHLVERLRRAGCVVVGKTNTPEYGWTACTTNALFGYTHNPWAPGRSAGGSSGGSAAAVASGMVPLATGSDGGGSLRIPSALCGLSGFKPSFGRVPAGGRKPPGWLHMSSKGPMAKSFEEIALVLDCVVGPEQDDLNALPRHESSFLDAVREPGLPIRVAWSPTLGYAEVDDEVRVVCERAIEALVEAGVDVVEVDPVFDEDPVIEWLKVVAACHARDLAHRRDDPRYGELAEPLRELTEQGIGVKGTDVVAAYDMFHLMNLRLVDLFRDARLLLTPTTAATAPREEDGILGSVNGRLDAAWVRFTYPFNMTRNPAGTLLAGLSRDGLPVGLQVVGPQHGDAAVLRSAAAFERVLAVTDRPKLLAT